MYEKEYIERDSLAGKLIEMKYCSTSSKIDFGDVIRLINSESTADVQEVIRCKDCIFGKYDDDLNMILCKRFYNLSGGEYVYNDLNDFCSYGSKMDKE